MNRARIAVLASGGGSNLQALLDHLDALGDARAADVVLVLANRADAGALDRARARGIAADTLREPGDGDALLALLQAQRVDLVVLAGYLKLVPRAVVARFRGRMLNVHPALLPAFGGAGMYGARVHQAVLDAGARISGATVHFVDDQYDRGPIAAQWPVPVYATDFADTLAKRVLRVEHLLLPRVVQAVAAGDVRLAPDGSVVGAFRDGPPDAAFTVTTDADAVAHEIDRALR
ncbi:phosphoribosylglycinamide formyltransferase [Gemmatirosa kalamazoonensis]|uniref:Phosphoribosylglycinamide formyltransferase n=1 Tax=Gemmatirosa kalamazoonensis TaxID=861299 RepID=W0RJB9_9BACT|nr:phosphoribosylglycinamide formyltransferase [Gemmatirosa kalamazoonensis]AHG90527.1 phosphoribosylglycinamide formyltransferase [Gemmatirosa kalamazoonensis]